MTEPEKQYEMLSSHGGGGQPFIRQYWDRRAAEPYIYDRSTGKATFSNIWYQIAKHLNTRIKLN